MAKTNHTALRAWNSTHKEGTPVTVSMIPNRFHGSMDTANLPGAGSMSRVATVTDGRAWIDGNVSVVSLLGFSDPVPLRNIKAL